MFSEKQVETLAIDRAWHTAPEDAYDGYARGERDLTLTRDWPICSHLILNHSAWETLGHGFGFNELH